MQAQMHIEGYEGGDSWSAASEGVLAALRLSKSAQSADKVHFSDSSGRDFLEIPAQKPLCPYHLVAVTNDHF